SHLCIFLPFSQTVCKAPCKDFSHASVIVGSFDSLDLKLAVIISLWSSPLIDYHGSHRLKTVCVGDIICLHPGDPVQVKKSCDLFHCSDRPSLFPLQPFFVLCKDQSGILRCQFHQFFFCPFFRDTKSHLL